MEMIASWQMQSLVGNAVDMLSTCLGQTKSWKIPKTG